MRTGTLRTIVLVTLVFALAPVSHAAKGGGKPPTGRTATSTVLDVDSAGTPFHLHSDSALSGTQVYLDGTDSVVSILQSGDEWELDGLASANRRFFVDFRDSAGGTAPFPSGFVRGRFVTKCFENGGLGIVGQMTGVGSTLACPGVFRFDMDNGDYYRLRMGWQRPETDWMKFTCTSVTGSDQSDPSAPCNAWTITPDGENDLNYVNLEGIIKVGGRGKTETRDLGYFYLSFRILLTTP